MTERWTEDKHEVLFKAGPNDKLEAWCSCDGWTYLVVDQDNSLSPNQQLEMAKEAHGKHLRKVHGNRWA